MRIRGFYRNTNFGGKGSGMKTIAYLRVSTDQQELKNQKFAILQFCQREGIQIDDWLEVTVSSRKSIKKRKLDQLLESVSPGDRIIVSELSRLGRSVGQIAMLVAELIDAGIGLVCIKEGIRTGNGKKLDITSKVQITMFSLFAEIERDLISERTKEALAARKAQGVKLGRPKGKGKSKLDQHREEIQALLANGSTKAWVAGYFKTSQSNLYNWLKKEESV
jgi:DNA invertase Pin-like site-specific DNA recombinase